MKRREASETATNPKVFGIGMPKTGTSSLNLALEMLGYRSCHFPHDATTVEEVRTAHYRLSILERYDALTDVPIPAIFAQLDAAWPGSKFILTVRDRSGWLDSCRRAPFNQRSALPAPGSAREFYRTLLYGCVTFDEGRFGWVYDQHVKAVQEHFSGPKAEQLLVLDVVVGEGWEKLCPFLGVPSPSASFPHVDPHVRKRGGLAVPSPSGGKHLRRFAERIRSLLPTGRRSEQ